MTQEGQVTGAHAPIPASSPPTHHTVLPRASRLSRDLRAPPHLPLPSHPGHRGPALPLGVWACWILVHVPPVDTHWTSTLSSSLSPEAVLGSSPVQPG